MELIKLEKYNCPNCLTLSVTLSEYDAEYQSINVEDNPEVASKYGIMALPVLLVLDDDGNEVSRMVGFNPGRIDELEEVLVEAGEI